MKKIRLICLLMTALLLLRPIFALNVCAAEDGCRTLDATAALGGSEKLLDTTKAAIVYERDSGTLIYAYNADERIYPSSMVKLMTALVALENGNLEDTVTVSRAALDSVAIGSVSAGLQRWEEISLRDLLYCMMVASANDAAAVIATHVGGSMDMFLLMMNEMAAELGCQDTNFSNVHGLHDKDTYTTARDICKILDYALNNETFRTMFEEKAYTVPATNLSEPRDIITTNYMMSKDYTSRYFDSRVTGGKTGATDKAGRCLAVTAQVNGMEVIGIVMGAQPSYTEDGLSVTRFGSFEEMSDLLDFVEEGFEFGQIFYENQVIDRYTVSGGGSDVAATPKDTVSCVVPKGLQFEDMIWEYDKAVSLVAPIAQGQEICTLRILYNGICIAQTDLVAMHGVSAPAEHIEPDTNSVQQQEEHHGRLLAIILGTSVGIIVICLVGIALWRMAHVAVVKARIRRRRRNRRMRNAGLE